MNKRNIRNAALAAALAFSVTTLAGCTINLGTSAATDHNGMMGDSSMGGMMGNDSTSAFSSADIMFAQMMIPHHQQAVDMGTLAQTRASDPAVVALAAKIKAEQAPEILQMKNWIEAAGSSMNMGHEMGMGGMLDKAEMAALTAATGPAFDKLYLQGMIGHHKGAIAMAQLVEKSDNFEVSELAKSIIASQTAQIEYMSSLLK